MYVEKRRYVSGIKYYLVHSYRERHKTKKIRKYLGLNLSEKELLVSRKRAEKDISALIEKLGTKVFFFTLTRKQVELINRYDEKVGIIHLDRKEWEKFTEDFVYSTNAIEGSTVRREEVPSILRGRAANSEEMETKGVAKAVDYIRKPGGDFSIELMKKLHKLCFEGSKPFAGSFRNVEVVVKNAKGDIMHEGTPVSVLGYALDELVSWYMQNKGKFRPLALAAIVHNQFEHVHPFQDGNGRVGRLLLNFILLKNSYPPVNISVGDRTEYYKALQEYSRNQDMKPTMQFLIRQYKKTLKKVTAKKLI